MPNSRPMPVWWKWDGEQFQCLSVEHPELPEAGHQFDITASVPGYDHELLKLNLRLEGNQIKQMDGKLHGTRYKHREETRD